MKNEDLDQSAPILDNEDAATLAAIDRGILSADDGQLVPLEEVRERIKKVAYKIFFTEDALSDLEIVLDYISAENPSAAERLGTSLLNQIDLLQSLPRIGVPVPGNPGVRKILHSPVRIYYRLHEIEAS